MSNAELQDPSRFPRTDDLVSGLRALPFFRHTLLQITSCRPWRAAAVVLIVAAVCLRLMYLAYSCPLDLAPDEAHYWDWSRHLDWSYYSKVPVVAYLIRASCEVAGSWSRELTG